MEEQKKSNDIEEAASALIANAENETSADQPEITPKESKATEENDNRIFKKYRIKDIVFLAIITACTLITELCSSAWDFSFRFSPSSV